MDGGGASTQTNRKRLYKQRVISLHTRAYSLLLLLFRFPTPTRWAAHFNQTVVVAPFFSPCTCTNCDHCAGFQHKGLGEDDVTMNCLLKRIIFTFFVVQNVLLNFLCFSFTTTNPPTLNTVWLSFWTRVGQRRLFFNCRVVVWWIFMVFRLLLYRFAS